MRRVILEAAMDAVVEHGYAKVTTQVVVERARVSRGAMLHHFPKKQDLLAALIRFIFERRNAEFTSALTKRADGQPPDELRALDVYWEQRSNPSFLAMVELSTAARTDPQLSTAFETDLKRPEASSEKLAGFADQGGGFDGFDSMADVIRCLVMGLTIAHDIGNSTDRREKVLSFARDAVTRLRPQNLSA